MYASPVKLIWIDDPRYEYPLGQGSFVIGRDESCTLPLRGNQKASRRHAEIMWHQGQFWLRDLGSNNGTKLNGIKVTQEMLLDGDVVEVAGLRLRVVNPYAPAPPDRAQAQAQAVAPGSASTGAQEGTGTMLGETTPGQAQPKRTVLLAGAAGGVLLVLLLGFLMTRGGGSGGGGSSLPPSTPYGSLVMKVNEVALITMPSAGGLVSKEGVINVRRHPSLKMTLEIHPVAAGRTEFLLQSADKKNWYAISITIEPKSEWPPGWVDSDRIQAADRLIADADRLSKNLIDFKNSALPAYYLYKKALRLYGECRNRRPAEEIRVSGKMAEIQPQIDLEEYKLLESLEQAWTAGDFAKAREYARQLLLLFPRDDTPGATASHGDPVKNRQYSMLEAFLEKLATGGGAN